MGIVTTSILGPWDDVDMKSLYAYAKTEVAHTKYCTKCETIKHVEDFNKHNKGRKGRMSWCKPCWSSYAKVYNSRPEAIAKRNEYKATDRGKAANRRSLVLKTYGPDALALDIKRNDPTTTCSACPSKKLLRIDHCHSSDRVRDILCHNCNVILGLAKDSPDRLRALADYLESWS